MDDPNRVTNNAIDKYRPDIDGLRAVAVISVVLYHAGLPGIPAGFVGVDVFFVLSGYLISAQLWTMRTRPIGSQLLDFYARRARRILPSLVIVIVTVLALGEMFLLPSGEQQDVGKSAIWSALFVSNIFFYRQLGDYFAGPAELQPFLHTWSLSVEEQYYLLWPLLLALLWFLARRRSNRRAYISVCCVVALISLLSLAQSIAWTSSNPGAAFFMMPSRFWELGSGAILAIIVAESGAFIVPRIAGTFGLACILGAVTFYTPSTPFPGIAAILPVGGTLLLIAAGATQTNGMTYRLLTWRPMTLTGVISYSWYLWHWPLIVLGRMLDLGAHNIPRDVALSALAYCLAYISTRYVEIPIRKRQIVVFSSARTSLFTAVGLLSLVTLLSLAMWMSARETYQSELAPSSLECLRSRGSDQSDNDATCALANGKHARIFLIGDSHANHWSPGITTWATGADVTAIERSFGGCPVPLTWTLTTSEAALDGYPRGCEAFSKLVMDEIMQSAKEGSPTAVVLAARWQAYATSAGALPGSILQSLDRTLSKLESKGIPTLLIGIVPRFEYPIPACFARRHPDACRISRSQYDKESMTASAMLNNEVGRHSLARFWDPAQSFCDKDFCYPSHNGVLMFRDAQHLSRQGAQMAARKLDMYLDWLIKERPD